MTTYVFLWALAMAESNNNDNAVGDGGRAVGAFQTWRVSVDEANRILGLKGIPPMFEYEDRTDFLASRQMAKTILDYWGKRWERKGHKMTNSDFAAMWRLGPTKWKPSLTLATAIDRGRAEKIEKLLQKYQ